MSDLQLETLLTANAGPLNAALQQGAQGVKAYGAAAEKAALEAAAASRQNTEALNALTAALAKAKGGGESYRKTTEGIRDDTRQVAAAMRMLPAQITDVTTSLAGGQSPLLVLLQQGGQVKDSFGGFAPMFRGLTAAITPAVIGFTGLAAAGGLLVGTYSQGAAEADAYRRALVLSGNAAGTTRSQMTGLAQSIDQVVGTQNLAAEVIAQVVGTGRVAAQNIELVSTTAIRLQRDAGIAVKDTVAEFAQLGKEPLEASKRLNEQYNYLTVKVYEQIKALEKRGQVEQAADLAQRTYATAMASRAAELEAGLGSIERAWRSVKDFAAEAWDAMLGVGRKKTPQQELAEALKSLDAFNNPDRKSQDPVRDETRKAAIKQRIEDLRLQLYTEGEVAAAEQSRSGQTRRHIATEKDREAAAKAANDAYLKFRQDMLAGLNVSAAELRAGRELTEVEQLELKLKDELAEAAKKVGGARLAEMRALAANRVEQQRLVVQQRDSLTALLAVNSAQRQAGIDAYRDLTVMEGQNDAMRQQIDALGLTAEGVARLDQVRIEAQITAKQDMLDELERVGLTGAQTVAIREQIQALRERQRLTGLRAVRQEEEAYLESLRRREEADRQADEQRRQGIAESISDGIAGGTLSAKKLWDLFRAELVRQFSRTVLMPSIRPAVDGADSWIKQGLSALAGWFSPDAGSVPADSSLSATGEMIRGRRAGGGQVEPWSRYLVGERGPEVLQMGSQGGSVLPNHAVGGGQPMVQNITYNVPPGMSPAAYAGALEQNNRRLKGEMAADMMRPGRPLQRAAARSGRF